MKFYYWLSIGVIIGLVSISCKHMAEDKATEALLTTMAAYMIFLGMKIEEINDKLNKKQ